MGFTAEWMRTAERNMSSKSAASFVCLPGLEGQQDTSQANVEALADRPLLRGQMQEL
jgi:hypothetical protein